VALEHEVLARLPLLPAQRPGAVEALDSEVGAQRLDVLLVDDRGGEVGEVDQQLGVRAFQFVNKL